jgi:hypothetical protein
MGVGEDVVAVGPGVGVDPGVPDFSVHDQSAAVAAVATASAASIKDRRGLM